MPSLSEIAQLEALEAKLRRKQRANSNNYKYRYQELAVKDLGISTPPRLKGLNVVLGWGSAAVEVLLQRLFWRGYWSPESAGSETAEFLNGLYRDNFMEALQKTFLNDALTTGASYISVGKGDTDNGEPEVLWRPESPNNTFGQYDQRTLKLTDCLKVQKEGDTLVATLWLPNSTTIFKKDKNSKEWLFHEKDEHELGEVTVVPVISNPDSHNPRGRSVITPSLQGLVDSGMRTLLGTELAREFYAQPLRALLGAGREDFVDEDGNPISVWDLITGKIINVPYNNEADILPQLMQLPASNPENIMQLIEQYSRLAAREIGVPPSFFGFETVNPSSADAINEADKKLIHNINSLLPHIKQATKKVGELSLLIAGKEKPQEWNTIESVFMRPETPTPQASADRVVKLNAMGIFERELPTWVYREIGLSEVEIKETKEFLSMQGGNSLIESLIASNANIGATSTGA